MKVGVSAGLGGLDILTEYVDEKKAYNKSFQNLTDWGRLVYTAGGYVANAYKLVGDDISEAMVLSGIPLLEKSIKGAIHSYVLQPMGLNKGRMGLKLKTPGRTPGGAPSPPGGNVRYI